MANNNSLENELKQLREQLEVLKQERQTETAIAAESTDARPDEQFVNDAEVKADSAAAVTATLGVDSNTPDGLIAQFREFLDSIDKDIKNEKPTTLLLVFALGVLVGRL